MYIDLTKNVRIGGALKTENFYSDIFSSKQNPASYSVCAETCGAHTLLGIAIRLFIPASVYQSLFTCIMNPGASLAPVEV